MHTHPLSVMLLETDMKPYLYSFAVLGLLGIFFFSNHAPVFGNTSITTIQGSDTLSASRTTINDNFSSLNSNKVEISDLAATTTLKNLSTLLGLVSVGTITSGTWSATPITVAEQGTGTTSPTLNQIMFGNAASGFKVIGFGNSGQALLSQGSAALPIWSSVSLDQTQNYNFTGTYFGVKNLIASSTAANPITLNTITYNTPSVRAASTTVLSEDGNGNLTWEAPDWQLLSATTTTATMGIATSTITGSHQDLRIVIQNPNAITGGATNYNLQFNADLGTNYSTAYTAFFGSADTATLTGQAQMSLAGQGSATTSPAYFEINIKNIAANVKQVRWTGTLHSSATAPPQTLIGSGVWNNTSAAITTIVLRAGGGSATTFPAGVTIQVYGSRN
jgi:hypothetical protein